MLLIRFYSGLVISVKREGCPSGHLMIKGRCYPKTKELIEAIQVVKKINKIDKNIASLEQKIEETDKETQKIYQAEQKLKKDSREQKSLWWKRVNKNEKKIDWDIKVRELRRKKGYEKQSLSYKLPMLNKEIRSELKRLTEIDTQVQDLTRYGRDIWFQDLIDDLEREKKTILKPFVETSIKIKNVSDKITFDIGALFDRIIVAYDQEGSSDLRPDSAGELIMIAGGKWKNYSSFSGKKIPVTVDLNILRKKSRYVSPYEIKIIPNAKEKEIRQLIRLIKDYEIK